MTEGIVQQLAQYIESLGGKDIVALDISTQSKWSKYFIIAQANSKAQLHGMLFDVFEYLEEHQITYYQSAKKTEANEWTIIDLGELVIHLMSPKSREFYALESLWREGKVIFDTRNEKIAFKEDEINSDVNDL